MRDARTEQFLNAVKDAVVAARTGGVTARACIFDATAAAVDQENSWPSTEGRRAAEAACTAIEPTTVAVDMSPRPRLPLIARLLFKAADYAARPRK